MNIVIAFILEAFTFRIDYEKTTDKNMDEDALVKVAMSLTGEEVCRDIWRTPLWRKFYSA